MVTRAAGSLDRREVVAALLAERAELLVIAGLGSPSYDVFAAGDSNANFYLWGAMGSAALMALGLAQAQPDRKVLAITGDGEQLMGLGGLATIAVAAPRNLTIVVLDNGHFGETGMQLSHTGHGLDLAKVASACGFPVSEVVSDHGGVERIRQALHRSANGPSLHVVRVKADNLPRVLPPRDAVHLKNRFRAHLGLSVN